MRQSFIEKQLIENYKKSFLAVWNFSESQSAIKQINIALKYLDENLSSLNTAVKNFLSSSDIFTKFVGAYLGVSFGVETSLAFSVFDFITTKNPKTDLEEKLAFYIVRITDEIKEKGYFICFTEQKNYKTYN